jgi:interferon-induced transmembrane protein
MSYDAPGGPPGGATPPPPGGYGAPPPGGAAPPPPGGYGAPPPGGGYGAYPTGGGYGQPGYGGYGQPGPGGYGQPYGKPPSTYRAWAITCIVCGVLFSLIIGLPCGLVALSNSRRVQSAWQIGDLERAAKASKRAMIWAIVATIFDVLGLILVVTLFSHGGTSTT